MAGPMEHEGAGDGGSVPAEAPSAPSGMALPAGMTEEARRAAGTIWPAGTSHVRSERELEEDYVSIIAWLLQLRPDAYRVTCEEHASAERLYSVSCRTTFINVVTHKEAKGMPFQVSYRDGSPHWGEERAKALALVGLIVQYYQLDAAASYGREDMNLRGCHGDRRN